MKKYDKLLLKYNKLLSDNKSLKHKVINLKTKLIISEQYLNAINSAFDLSQKLSQHLKTENSLLRTSQELLIIPIDNNVNNSLIISDNEVNDCLDNNKNINNSNNNNNNNNSNSNCDNNLCKSDLIANQYETDIKEWKEEMELLSDLPLIEVLIGSQDQMAANELAIDSDDGSDHEMDVDLNDNSQNIPVIDPKPEVLNKMKCGTCGRKFRDESHLKEHKSLHTTEDNRIKCAESCLFTCDSKHELKDHLNIHRNKTAINETPKQFFNKHLLKIKLNSCQTSSTKRMFQCKECKKELSSMQSLRQHQRAVHNMISWFKCKYSGCEQKFQKQIDLRVHEELHRQHGSQLSDNLVKSDIKQSNTDLTFEKSQNIFETSAQNPVVSQYFSPINGNTDSIENDSNCSQLVTISEQFKYKCEYNGCNAKYKHKPSLKKHEERVHKNIMSSQSSDNEGNDGRGDSLNDMELRMRLLSQFYEQQKKHVQMSSN